MATRRNADLVVRVSDRHLPRSGTGRRLAHGQRLRTIAGAPGPHRLRGRRLATDGRRLVESARAAGRRDLRRPHVLAPRVFAPLHDGRPRADVVAPVLNVHERQRRHRQRLRRPDQRPLHVNLTGSAARLPRVGGALALHHRRRCGRRRVRTAVQRRARRLILDRHLHLDRAAPRIDERRAVRRRSGRCAHARQRVRARAVFGRARVDERLERQLGRRRHHGDVGPRDVGSGRGRDIGARVGRRLGRGLRLQTIGEPQPHVIVQRIARAVAQRFQRRRDAAVNAAARLRRGAEQIAFHARLRSERPGRVGQPAFHLRAQRLLVVRRDTHVVDDAFAIQLADRGDGVEVRQAAVVDDLQERPHAVEQPQDAIDLVGNVGEPFGQQAVIDLEDRIQRGHARQQPPPLVDAAQSLHQQVMRRRLDRVLAADALPLDGQPARRPAKQPVHGVTPRQPPDLGVDDAPLPEEHLAARAFGADDQRDARLLVGGDGAHQINERHVFDGADEALVSLR